MIRRMFISLLAVGSMAAVAACGGDDSASPPPEVDADLIVRAVPSIRWDADSYTVASGDVTIAMVNEENVRHTLVVLDGNVEVGGMELLVNRRGDVDTGTIPLEPGTYRIFCTVPGHQNMNSELIVT